MAFGLGPIFFTLINTSLSRGVRVAIYFSLGVCSGDFILAFSASFIQLYLKEHASFLQTMKITSLPIFLLMALYFYFKNTATANMKIERKNTEARVYLQGLLIYLLNPVNLIAWLFLWSVAVSEHYPKYLFIALIILVIFMSEFFMALMANRFRVFYKPAVQQHFNKFLAAIFVIIAAKSAFELLG